jgi:hypothetical protein
VTKTIGATALGVLLCLAGPGAARADFKVFTPDVNRGELAVETVGDAGLDRDPAKNGERSYTTELEYGLTNWWMAELELEYNRDAGPNQPTLSNQATLENVFQFTQRGEYWLDAGFFAEYGQSLLKNVPNETTFGPILRKDFWGTSNTVNLFFQKDLGEHASGRPVFLYAWETRIDAWTVEIGQHFLAVEPGFQYFGAPGPLGHFARWGAQDQRAGPQLFGQIYDIGPGSLEWNGGVLFGLTSAVPLTTVRWQFEYEIHY